jgi:hypothetical protein
MTIQRGYFQSCLNMRSPRTKASAAHVPIGLHMNNRPMDGLLFFSGGRELPIVAYAVSRTSALVHSDRLGLLPIDDLFITFDDFLTVGRCRLDWRHRDDFGVVFEKWIDVRERIVIDQAR